MAQNITLLGASYSDVPSVELPKTGGGTAQFDDTTIASNAASASDIANGKLAFVNGELVTGTASGGGATLITKSITANGTYNASSDNADGYSSVTVNVSGGGGGGLVYETGTWTPSSDIASPTISFANAHTTRPFFVMLSDVDGTEAATSTTLQWAIFSAYDIFSVPIIPSSTTSYYAYVRFSYKTASGATTGGTVISSLTGSTSSAMPYYLTNSNFTAYASATSRYYRSGITYKWIAVWAPTS